MSEEGELNVKRNREWRERMYPRLVERDGERCKWCGKTPGETPQGMLAIDHVEAKANGGSNALENLQLLCTSCNSTKGPRPENQPTVRHSLPAEQLGFTMIPNAVLLNTKLTLAARVLYGALKFFAWSNTECYPGQKRLSEMLGVSERSVRAYIDELVSASLVRTEKRGFGKTNLYVILPIPNPHFEISRAEISAGRAADISAQTGSTVPVSTGSLLPTKKTQEVKKKIQIETSEEEAAVKAENARLLAELRKATGL